MANSSRAAAVLLAPAQARGYDTKTARRNGYDPSADREHAHGKTLLAQRLLERHGAPHLSIDHLKMGLIRAGCVPLTPESTRRGPHRRPLARGAEIVKTAVKNGQSLTVEGCHPLQLAGGL